jgi:hypothetical protein
MMPWWFVYSPEYYRTYANQRPLTNKSLVIFYAVLSLVSMFFLAITYVAKQP